MESLNILRSSFRQGLTKSIEYRKSQLKSIFNMMDDNESLFLEALKKDMNKCEAESKMTEILMVKQEVSYLLKNIDNWTRPQKVAKTFLTLTDSCHIQYQPYGVALCIGAWNYPVQLTLVPLAGLIATGNCVMLKPSELAENTERLLAELLPKYLDKEIFAIELGDGKRTGEILQEKFDLIMYTGSGAVARIVMTAAAKHLTPVVLELGGKSPVYIDTDVELKMAMKRLIWAKFLNCGQTCVAPDYLLVHKDKKSEVIELSVKLIEEFFGKEPANSPDYSRIINERHFNRIMSYIKETEGKVICGGNSSKTNGFYIEPTIVVLDKADDSLMKEELFGPILPIITVSNETEAIDFINQRDKPLGLYIFSSNRSIWSRFEDETSSGALLINDALVQCGVMGIPFGGVGASGMGSYHGKASIESFSHCRGVLNRDTKEIVHNLFRYPPYNSSKISWTEWGLKSNANDRSYCNIM